MVGRLADVAEAKRSAFEAAQRAAALQAAQRDAWDRLLAFSRLPRRALSLGVAAALNAERSRPEDHRRHSTAPTNGAEVPDDGQADGGGETNQIHGGQGAADRGTRK